MRHMNDVVLAEMLDADNGDGDMQEDATDDGMDHDGDEGHGGMTDYDPDQDRDSEALDDLDMTQRCASIRKITYLNDAEDADMDDDLDD